MAISTNSENLQVDPSTLLDVSLIRFGTLNQVTVPSLRKVVGTCIKIDMPKKSIMHVVMITLFVIWR